MKKLLLFFPALLLLLSCSMTQDTHEEYFNDRGERVVRVQYYDEQDRLQDFYMNAILFNQLYQGNYRNVYNYHQSHYSEPTYRSQVNNYRNDYRIPRYIGGQEYDGKRYIDRNTNNTPKGNTYSTPAGNEGTIRVRPDNNTPKGNTYDRRPYSSGNNTPKGNIYDQSSYRSSRPRETVPRSYSPSSSSSRSTYSPPKSTYSPPKSSSTPTRTYSPSYTPKK